MTAVIKRFRKALSSIYKSVTKTTTIERYLNSLPEDILVIDVSNKNIKSLPDLTRFTNLQELHCSGNKLNYLPALPENLKILHCSGNNLTSLQDLPRNLKILFCDDNQLTSLHRLPENLKILYCYNNKLNYLPALPENLEILNCSINKLNYLPNLPQKIQTLSCYCNPIYEIVNSNTLFQIKKNIQILNNFRHLYYCLKFKKQLSRIWLWVKVREPIAMKKYSPLYLIKNLGDEDDLDTILDNWE